MFTHRINAIPQAKVCRTNYGKDDSVQFVGFGCLRAFVAVQDALDAKNCYPF